jgi:hypothetical protein
VPEFTPGRAQVTTTTMIPKRADRYSDGYWIPPFIQPSHTLGAMRPGVTQATRVAAAADGVIITPDHLCPDLLRLSNIGAADGWRGRVVRGFFNLMRLWPPRERRPS